MLTRKFALAVLISLTSSVFVPLELLTGAVWANLNGALYAGFTLGNLCEHYLTGRAP